MTRGISQAHAAARRLKGVPFDFVVSSPLIRAVKTVEIIAAECRKSVDIDADLIECDFGSFEGRSIAEVMHEHGITAKALATILPSDGEAWASVSQPSLRCVDKWIDRDPRGNILFVSHDAVMQSMSEALCNGWFDNRDGTPFRFTRTGDMWTIDEV